MEYIESEIAKSATRVQLCGERFKELTDQFFGQINQQHAVAITESYSLLKQYRDEHLNPALLAFIKELEIYADCALYRHDKDLVDQLTDKIDALKVLQHDYAVLCIDIRMFIAAKAKSRN